MAAPNSRQEATATDFQGQISSSGTQAKTPGVAAVQVNLVANTVGELSVRPGLKVVTFADLPVDDTPVP